MAIATTGKDMLAKFFDDGAYRCFTASTALSPLRLAARTAPPCTPCARTARPRRKRHR